MARYRRRYRRLYRRRRFRRRLWWRRRRYYKARHRFHTRSFRKRIKRLFFNKNPRWYTVKLPNPYNIQNIFFQGIIFIPKSVFVTETDKESSMKTKIIECLRQALVSISFGAMLKAAMPLDAASKTGGPVVGQLGAYNSNRPDWDLKTSMVNMNSLPFDWWRWALLFMRPSWDIRTEALPGVAFETNMVGMLEGWQLMRHVKTSMLVEATKSHGSWSPVATLAVQDRYWAGGTGNRAWVYQTGSGSGTVGLQTPLPGHSQHNINEQPSQSQTYQPKKPDEYFFPNWPPGYFTSNSEQGDMKETGYYTGLMLPSFATLSALGASWSFPPTQQSVSKRSFTKIIIKGNGDPMGKKWMTLWPKNNDERTYQIPLHDDEKSWGDLYTPVGQVFLAQATDHDTLVGNFGTLHDRDRDINAQRTWPDEDNALLGPSMQHWAIIKIQSQWQLGNTRRPWWYDCRWGKVARSKFLP